MQTEDGHIIRQCLNGNPAAFGFLVDKYRASIHAFAYTELGNFHDAEDMTQEVFIRAYQKLRTLRRWDNFLAWIYSITSNLCKTWIQNQLKRPDREIIEDQDPESLEEPSIVPHSGNLVFELLNETLESLPRTYRQVLTLYYLGSMNSVEIARFLGVSPTAIRQRLTRARSKLKEGMLAMMSKTFEQQKLQASFTFRIVEAVKRIKIHPTPRTAGLPWGLSLATGIFITVMSLSPYLNLNSVIGAPAGSALSSRANAMKLAEIPINILVVSDRLDISTDSADDSGISMLTELQSAFPMAAQGQGNTWTRKFDIPTPRTNLSASTVNEKIYVIGGRDPAATMNLQTVEEYDPKTNRWTRKADMPTARRGLSTCMLDERIYAIGGWSGTNETTPALEVYDPATDTWTKKANMPGGGRATVGAAAVNGKVYAIAGWGPGRPFSIVEEYDPVMDTWTRKTGIPTPRGYLSASAVNGKIYAIGGRAGTFQNPIDLSTVEEYDPATDTWTKKSDLPNVRYFLSTSVVDDKVYAIGGGPNARAIEEYDPTTDTWIGRASMPTGRNMLATSAANGKIYAIGGGSGLSTVEEYTPEGWQSSPVSPQGKLPTKWGKEKETSNSKTHG